MAGKPSLLRPNAMRDQDDCDRFMPARAGFHLRQGFAGQVGGHRSRRSVPHGVEPGGFKGFNIGIVTHVRTFMSGIAVMRLPPIF